MSEVFTKSQMPWLNDASVLVTGGAGFIGSHIVTRLIELGARVTVLDNFSTGYRSNIEGLPIRIVEGSVASISDVETALKGNEHVLHLGAIPAVPRSIDDPLTTAEANLWGTQIVLECARRARVKRVVFSASSSAYGAIPNEQVRTEDMAPAPLSPYAAHKLCGEYLALTYALSFGLQTVSLRYFNIFGPRQAPDSPYSAVVPKFMQSVLDGKPITVHGDGEQMRDFTYIDNAVLANLLSLRPDVQPLGQVFNVGCGQTYSINTLVREIEKIAGRRVDVQFKPVRAGDVRFSLASIERAQKTLGYRVVVPFQEGLRNVWEHLSARN